MPPISPEYGRNMILDESSHVTKYMVRADFCVAIIGSAITRIGLESVRCAVRLTIHGGQSDSNAALIAYPNWRRRRICLISVNGIAVPPTCTRS